MNLMKLYVSYMRSKQSGKDHMSGLPFSLSIEPTTSCNLRCPQCPSGLRDFTRPTGMLRPDAFKKFIQQSKEHVHSLMFYFQGEPFLNTSFLEMVKHANENKIYTITSTNAHYLTDEICKQTIDSGLDELVISIDGITQEVYESYRIGGQLDKVLEGAARMIKWKKEKRSRTPYVVFQFVVFRTNEHQIEGVKELGRTMGADKVKIKTAQIYDFETSEQLIPTQSKYSRYAKDQSGKWHIKNLLLNQCWRMWQGCVITWDGKVVPCCFDKDAKYQMGDLLNNTLNEVWYSDAYKNFRAKLLNGRSGIDICTNCTEGTKVWAEIH